MKKVSSNGTSDLVMLLAMFELTKIGFTVCAPMASNASYDLIIERSGTMKRVSVSLSTQKNAKDVGQLVKVKYVKVNDDLGFDILFVLSTDRRGWLIPVGELNRESTIELGKESCKFQKFSTTIDSSDENTDVETSDITHHVRSDKQASVKLLDSTLQSITFTPERVQTMLLTQTLNQIALHFGITEVGLQRWIIKWNLSNPHE